MFIKSLFVFSFVIAAAFVNADGHHPDSPSFKTTKIADNIYLLQGKGGNIAVQTGEDGLLVVDNDYAEMSDALKRALEQFGGIESVVFVVNTHWHGDHTANNAVLGEHAHIAAHKNVRKRLASSQTVPLFNMVTEPAPEVALPNLTYKSGMHLHHNNDKVKLRHFGIGHTDGDTVVFFRKANVVHMGDLFFNGFFPFVDVDNEGNVVAFAKAVGEALEKIDDETVVIPGHGPLATKADLVAFHKMLLGTTAEVQKLKSNGKTLEQAKAKGLSKKWKEWTDGFISTEVWIELVYRSL